MKKITHTARVIDIFSTESLDACAILLEVAHGLIRERQSRNAPKAAAPARRRAATADHGTTIAGNVAERRDGP